MADIVTGTDTGLLIQKVVPNTPAQEAGLRGGSDQVTISDLKEPLWVGGDVIVRIDNVDMETKESLHNFLDSHQVGDKVTFVILRAGRQIEVPVVLGYYPSLLPPR